MEIDERPVWDNAAVKEDYIFVPDELFFVSGNTIKQEAKMYEIIYRRFDRKRLEALLEAFHFDMNTRISTLSKGMKRQVAVLLALACKPKYYFFDETFDGLDPIMRNNVKKLIYEEVCERGCTAVVTSHSLLELEDMCDQLAVLHEGGIVFEQELDTLKSSLTKIQVAFAKPEEEAVLEKIECLSRKKSGRVVSLIIRGDGVIATEQLKQYQPILLEVLPLSLEEIFTYEIGAIEGNTGEALGNLLREMEGDKE